MGAKVQRWASAHTFLDTAVEFLAAREAEHCVLIGIANLVANHPEVYREPRFWTVHDDGRVVAVAIRTPPHNLLMSQIDDRRHLIALAEDVLASDQLPGVLGPVEAARTLADAWSARTGGIAERVVQERIFRLDRVSPPRPAPGRCREAEERDRSLLADWWAAFHAEATPELPLGDTAEIADRVLRRAGRVGYLWEHDGEVVALASAGGQTPRGIRIGPVYTPPARRGRGYATNLVAEVSQRELAAGRQFCFLFTDLANPVSNRIYQAIGYQPVVDVDQYRFR